MVLQGPLRLWALPAKSSPRDIHASPVKACPDRPLVKVASLEDAAAVKTLDAEILAGSNSLTLYVFANEKTAPWHSPMRIAQNHTVQSGAKRMARHPPTNTNTTITLQRRWSRERTAMGEPRRHPAACATMLIDTTKPASAASNPRSRRSGANQP
jgi:hypothetical protein